MPAINDSSWSQACYSCKGQHYWEGCYRKERADCSLSEGMMGDERAASSEVTADDEKQESTLLARARISEGLLCMLLVIQ